MLRAISGTSINTVLFLKRTPVSLSFSKGLLQAFPLLRYQLDLMALHSLGVYLYLFPKLLKQIFYSWIEIIFCFKVLNKEAFNEGSFRYNEISGSKKSEILFKNFSFFEGFSK